MAKRRRPPALDNIRRMMGHYGQKAIAIVAACGLLYLLDDVRQYWGAVETVGAVSSVDARESCREGDTIMVCTHSKHVMVAYTDQAADHAAAHTVDRVTEVNFEPFDTFFADRRRPSIRVHPVVGLQVPLMVVSARPQLTRIAAYHRQNRHLLWLKCVLLAALAGLAWFGKLPMRSWNRAERYD